jgi:hypothetical protein
MATPSAERNRLTLGVAAPRLRGVVGPIAWSVLEAIAERAEPDAGRTVSHRSVRELAAELRLANDTVARAIRRLADAGLLHHATNRQANGRFGSGCYLLCLPPNVFDDPTPPDPSPLTDPALPRRASSPTGEQLALLSET